MFARERISQLIKDFFFFFDAQHIIKSAPIVIVPNQPPLSVSLLSLRGQILHQVVGQLVCVIQRLRNNRGEMESTLLLLLLLLLFFLAVRVRLVVLEEQQINTENLPWWRLSLDSLHLASFQFNNEL